MKKKGSTKKDVSNEDLARMVAGGFDRMEKRFETMENRFEDVENHLETMGTKIDDVESRLGSKINGLHNRIDDLALNRATRDEVHILSTRMTRVEKKIGISFNSAK